MDDLSIMTTNVPMGHIALERASFVVSWARMKVKPSKSRGFVIHRGQVQKSEPFCVDGETIPGLHRSPLRTLGRVFDFSISDKIVKETLNKKFVLHGTPE